LAAGGLSSPAPAQHLRSEGVGFFEYSSDNVGAGIGVAEPGGQGLRTEYLGRAEAEIGEQGGVSLLVRMRETGSRGRTR